MEEDYNFDNVSIAHRACVMINNDIVLTDTERRGV